jgi:hypothetical protein
METARAAIARRSAAPPTEIDTVRDIDGTPDYTDD